MGEREEWFGVKTVYFAGLSTALSVTQRTESHESPLNRKSRVNRTVR